MLILVATVVAVTSSVGAPLIPAVADLHDVPLHVAQWSLTMPLLVGAVATPVLGRLGDGSHRRAVALTALGLVVLGGVLTALPLPLGWFLAGRGLQGFGLGLMPLLVATARDALPAPRSRRAIAALSITVVSGVGLGYPIAGAIATYGGATAAFWTATAICAGALVAAALVLPPASPNPPRRFDLPGALLLGVGLAGALITLSEGEGWGWTSPRVLLLSAASLLLLGTWVVVALRTRAPLIDLRLARGRLPASGHVSVLLVSLANYLLLGSVPILAQTPEDSGYGFGASGMVAGLLLLPFSLAGMLAGPLSRRLGERVRPRVVLSIGALLMAGAQALFALDRADLWALLVVTAVAGLGVSTVFAAAAGLVVSAVPPRETGSAMALNQVLRYAGFAVGSASTATVLAVMTPAGGDLPGGGAYTVIGLIGSGTCVLAALVAWLLAGQAAAQPPSVAPRASGDTVRA
ncbi:MFS transporter [Geodermatophilus ruber]|uniref:Major Facilitator Superfamily protein n=1 Tax=Geodermatophilus ruber TaxID=504800 RepID=A0A1I4HRH3_9ACTN|nr:MFS transporter [Geodermatophilus ruber]SFL44745.1 Major Facilitator Superfamily protein [Geodermatophilus ruber]